MTILNGALREVLRMPALGPYRGMLASGALLCAAIFVASYLAATSLGCGAVADCWAVGALWLALTVSFEIGFGRFVQQRSLSELLGAYTFEGGNLWPLVLLVLVLAPWLAVRVRGIV